MPANAKYPGQPFHGEFHGTSSTGGTLDLYDESEARIHVSVNDRLIVLWTMVACDVSGDSYIYFDYDGDGTPNAGSYIVRGTIAPYGRVEANFPEIGRQGIVTSTTRIKCVTASGVNDAFVVGTIVRARVLPS